MNTTSVVLSCKPISRDGVHLYVKEVQHGLERVLKKCPDDWTAADVFSALYRGTAFLYIMEIDGQYNGFFVLEPAQCPFKGTRSVNVWALYSTKLYLQELAEQLRLICAGTQAIRFFSPRRWDRKLRGLMAPKMTIYEAKLNERIEPATIDPNADQRHS